MRTLARRPRSRVLISSARVRTARVQDKKAGGKFAATEDASMR